MDPVQKTWDVFWSSYWDHVERFLPELRWDEQGSFPQFVNRIWSRVTNVTEYHFDANYLIGDDSHLYGKGGVIK